MNDPRTHLHLDGPCGQLWFVVFGLVPLLFHAAPVRAAGGKAPVVVGKNASPAGSLLVREAPDKAWQVAKPQATVSSDEEFMALPGTRADVDVKDGAVRLTLWGNLPELSQYPVLESVVQLRFDPAADLDFQLERGRAVITNRKAKGASLVRTRFEGQTCTWRLNEPGTSVALELFGRWPRGVPFSQKPRPEDKPTISVAFLVLAGQADLRIGKEQFSLRAPPGPARFFWDNVQGAATGPSREEKLPSWVESAAPMPDAKAALEAVGRLRQRLAEKPLTPTLTEAMAAGDIHARMLGVYGLAAIDDLPRVLDALGDAAHADCRETAVEALRQWIGRGPHEDMKLYNVLIRQRKYTPAQAEIVLQLLHSFSAEDLQQPETYETLIAYLRAGKLSIRELAKWHLYRAVPAGKAIPYDPAGSDGDQARAFQAWKKLIPEGKLPPKPKSE